MGLHPSLFGINYFGKQKNRLLKDKDSIPALTPMPFFEVEMNLKKRENEFHKKRKTLPTYKGLEKMEFAKLRKINKLNELQNLAP